MFQAPTFFCERRTRLRESHEHEVLNIAGNIDCDRLTMNVAHRAISFPQVSTMISSVRACVDVSIPLLTKINNGKFFSSRRGLNCVSVDLNKLQVSSSPTVPLSNEDEPHALCGYSKQNDVDSLDELGRR